MELDNLTPILIGTDRGFVAVRLSKAFEICKKHSFELKDDKNKDYRRLYFKLKEIKENKDDFGLDASNRVFFLNEHCEEIATKYNKIYEIHELYKGRYIPFEAVDFVNKNGKPEIVIDSKKDLTDEEEKIAIESEKKYNAYLSYCVKNNFHKESISAFNSYFNIHDKNKHKEGYVGLLFSVDLGDNRFRSYFVRKKLFIDAKTLRDSFYKIHEGVVKSLNLNPNQSVMVNNVRPVKFPPFVRELERSIVDDYKPRVEDDPSYPIGLLRPAELTDEAKRRYIEQEIRRITGKSETKKVKKKEVELER